MNETPPGFGGFKPSDAPAIDPKLKTIRVKAKNFVTVDGLQFNEGQEGLITPDQYVALARNFEHISGEWHTSPKVRLNKGDKINAGVHIGKNEEGEIVKTPIKGAILAKAAALIALMIGLIRLICPISVQAAPPFSYGQIPILYSQNASNVYNTNETLVYPINPAVGTSTNGQTNAYNVFPLTNATGGGGGGFIAPNSTNFLTNAAGISGSLPINLTRFDEITLVMSFGENTNTGAQSIDTTNVVQFLVSGDGTNWGTLNTNVWQFSFSPTATISGGTNAVLVTNINRSTAQGFASQGYLQLSFVGCMGTNGLTNPVVQIYAKPVRSGN